jgi:ATP-dependent Lon protease
MMILLDILQEEIEMLKLEEEILKKVKKQIDQQQKEYYLREQLKIIQEELGEQTDLKKEIETYKKQLQVKNFSKEIILKLEKEMDRLFKIPTHSPESNMVRTYIETVLELPSIYTEKENINLKKIKRILDEAHYGLTEVKERILEYLAVRQMSDNLVAPIICLVGPPGIGKTSIVKSVAEAIGRNYVRVSLGGVRDEAEIRGHRRTYIGAQPGRIVNVLCQAKTNNPVILLDEIDKMIGDFRGDPAAALLEVLDKEQNTTFRDHYLEIPLDLSQVMFMVTANTLTTLPRPLLDRMEIIEINGYSLFEKQEITKQYLLPKQLKLHGLQKGKCKIASPVFKQLIEGYTKEAGVRQLERQIATICRKCVKELIENEKDSLTISFKKVEEYLGPAPYVYHIKNEIAEIGVVRGLAWTAVGGDTLSIEVNLMPGKGHLELTGNIGKVMKESAQAAMSYIRSQEKILNLPPNFYKEMDMHIHIPEGAVPKDGPSAGITMAAAMISALLLKTIRPDIAMTGEITIRGRVLGIGGLKEKILAAKRAGIYEVIVPAQNEKEIQKLDANILEQMKVIYVKTMEDVLKHVFVAETEVKI